MIKYVSPINLSQLKKTPEGFVDSDNNLFPLQDGLPNFIHPKILPQSDLDSLEWYKNNADSYDEYLPLTFQTFGVDEDAEREKLVDKLDLRPGDIVLETGCGSGRDSVKIAERIGKSGKLYLQDISPNIIRHAVNRFKTIKTKPETYFSLANGYYLPFEDGIFDKVFHFGGFNTFGDKKRALFEMTRVIKPGGRVVFGDENMPVWLRDTEFGKVLMNSNPHYRHNIPFESIPINARNISVEWIMGGVFYVVKFDKGNGTPNADFDFKIPGIRGGTHRTRYYGHIEGMSSEVIRLAKAAREKRNISMFDWLEEAIRFAAKKDLDEK
jgi:ubiquinone/menaquinone biosynthesis C-methylase UbiE